MITVGVDVGSLLTKMVVLDGDDLVASSINDTTGNIVDELPVWIEDLLSKAKLERSQIKRLAATGNGADLVKGADFSEDEVACVAAAAYFSIAQIEMAIHIGGQSITALSMDENGEVKSFMRNDKCASGSGRFIENMASKLNVSLTDIEDLVAQSEKQVLISNQCGVFAESEVISHVNDGERVPDIFAGICAAVANIVVSQGRRFAAAEHFTLTGGVARITPIVKMICDKLGGEYHELPYDPRLAAAIGAAVLAGS
ncbi:MAG: acyl-CoA dehydratase activase [Candidatus Alcyoniella australis]|nr:acyl-CoA dehydratase activase [Candidatus Alcyoniella australis]